MELLRFVVAHTILDSIWAILVMLPISLPIILMVIAHKLFRRHNLIKLINSEKNQLLEIKLPREQLKSPRAMELVISTVCYQTSQGNWYTKYFRGRHRRWFSLELISMEGAIHFLIRTPSRFRNSLESAIYSQYPDVEIREVDDYTSDVDFLEHQEKWSLFGMELVGAKPSCFPFKTYVDFGLDKDPKEEYKNDPLLGIIESMGTMGPGEYLWTQILIRASMPQNQEALKKSAEEEVKKLVKKEKKISGSDLFKVITDKATPGETIIAESIERKLMKPIFDVGLRTFYVAKKEVANSASKYCVSLPYRVFNNPQGNSIKPSSVETDFDHPYSFDQLYFYPKKYRIPLIERNLFDSYRKRSYFYPPYERTPMQLNVEELATLWHFPGRVSETPTLARIESKRGEPPVNLPI